jgi:hypothetical protein
VQGNHLLSVSAEVSITSTENTPSSIVPDQVEIKMYKTFVRGAWEIELSKNWISGNIVETERLQRNEASKNEFIVRLKNNDLLLERSQTNESISTCFAKYIMELVYLMNGYQQA